MPVDAIAAYRPVIAVPGLYRALEDGLSTWLVGQGPSGQLVSCSLPGDPGNPNGREAWLGPAEGRPHPSGVTVEYLTGGVGCARLDGTGARVYATTLIGRCPAAVTRITVHHEGEPERDAVLADGVWLSQVLRGAATGPLAVRGFDASGRLVAERSLGLTREPARERAVGTAASPLGRPAATSGPPGSSPS
ncbi:hypothetical protein [Streptacidiphilus sp. P02-A3a]|uniref:hypothetical protein n=1 Tax=Streptacidiphilus sp. P02-A3a TaxID=2704468 RepID=UPI0015F7EC82|nr:hypothetical protein [Streptacidiphilus sp. P02-A3a]QMU73199.1 hypothetical protein GXP74_38185 [Streptacidiphilus sp. P02-A3a]